tara:strand:- start:10259 stop:11743 length:1485 start_codon:yes stop_codon:yes gene_type:complete
MTMDGRSWLEEAERACARGDRMGGLYAVEQILASDVKLGTDWAIPTMMAHELGDADMAARAASRLCSEDGSDIRQWRLLASALEQIGKAREAAAIHKKLLADNPDDVELNFEAGHTLKLLGDFAAAEDRFRKVVSLDKSHWRGWEHLASVHRFEKGDEDLIALETRRVENIEGGGDKVQQADLSFALAKAYDDLGEPGLVARRIAEAAEIAREKAPYDAGGYRKLVNGLIDLYTPQFVEQHTDQGLADARPIFVLGPPRSGTTLVEAIIGAHPEAIPGGEHKLLWLSLLPVGAQIGGDLERYLADPAIADPWAALGERYVGKVQARLGDAKRWTDKNLYNNQRLGAAALALPAAKFIWCRRDPMDVAWSAYRTRFGEGNLWSYSPDGIAAFLSDYDALMEHWVSLFPDRILEVRYEDLVRQPDVEIPRLLEFVGLKDDAATRNFHESDRPIATASLAQVRQPINTASIGAWKRYMPHIDALPEALEKAGLVFDS